MILTATRSRSAECGMTLIAVMAVMSIFAFALLAVAPTIQQEVQREKEEESIRRGEEIAEAIKQYVTFYQGRKLPESIDDLLEGLPQGTKKRMILRASAATDPLSEDGKWLLVQAKPETIARVAARIQTFNNGLLPGSGSQALDQYARMAVNVLNTESEDSVYGAEENDSGYSSSDTPFIGVVSQSKSRSVLAYYGVENHSKWVFTPLFRGGGSLTTRPFVRPDRVRPN
ncbi:MAG TPA: type II secretion system protein [Pyrinomonadaceae bacterium]|nr:type II secretion system protein [Pyrinomonadaceae bacterium]